MIKIVKKIAVIANSRSFKLVGSIGLVIGLVLLSASVFAEDSTDLLANTTSTALATINKSGRNWAYIIDGAISLGAFAKTKNPFVFFSVLAVALGITVIYKMAGGT